MDSDLSLLFDGTQFLEVLCKTVIGDVKNLVSGQKSQIRMVSDLVLRYASAFRP